jgi:hypothetical protein
MAFDIDTWHGLSEADRKAFFDGIRWIVAARIKDQLDRISQITNWHKALDWKFNCVRFFDVDPDYWQLSVQVLFDGPGHETQYYAESNASLSLVHVRLVYVEPAVDAFEQEIRLNSENIATDIFDKMLEIHDTSYSQEMQAICDAKDELAKDYNYQRALHHQDLAIHAARKKAEQKLARYRKRQRRRYAAPWNVNKEEVN